MSNLPRLELKEENSTLKNNEFIVFRHQSKSKTIKKVSKNNASKKRKSYNNRSNRKSNNRSNKRNNRKSNNRKKSNKSFFNLF